LDDAAGSQTVTVTGSGNFTLGNVRADVLTTTGITGTVSATLTNSTGGSVFSGGSGATTITGTALADQITTGLGNDVISGGNGADRIDAGNGSNTITGGAGDDILTGGTGVDTYVFSATTTNGNDTITNFTGGTDKLNVVNMTAAAITAGTLLSSAGATDTTTNRANYLQVINTDGTAASIVTGATGTISLAQLTAGTLTNVAAFISEKFSGASSTTGTDTGIYVINYTASGSTTSYIYQWDNDTTANVVQAAELALVGVITRGTTTLVNSDFIIS
jgi:Ca2+-binding RTX toxin-like protein